MNFNSSPCLRYVFPTCVGMNRLLNVVGPEAAGVPYMRRDEPVG